jgi:uncharacterized Zn finger protein
MTSAPCPRCDVEMEFLTDYHEFSSGWHQLLRCPSCREYWSSGWGKEGLRSIAPSAARIIQGSDPACPECVAVLKLEGTCLIAGASQDLYKCMVCGRFWSMGPTSREIVAVPPEVARRLIR